MMDIDKELKEIRIKDINKDINKDTNREINENNEDINENINNKNGSVVCRP